MQNDTITTDNNAFTALGNVGEQSRIVDKTIQNATSSTFTDNAAEPSTPCTLRIAHEQNKAGTITSSVIILDKTYEDSVTGETEVHSMQLKVRYGTNGAISKAALYEDFGEFLSTLQAAASIGTDGLSIIKFYNKEH